MSSIRRRLSLGLVTSLVIAGVLLAQISIWLFEQGLRRYLENHLRIETETLLRALVRQEGEIRLDPRRLAPAYDRPFSGQYYVVHLDAADQAPAQRWRSRSFWDTDTALPDKAGLQEELVPGPQGQQLILLRADYHRLGRDAVLVVGRDYRPMLESLRRIQLWVLGGGALALLLILWVQRQLVTRALAPLETARLQLAQLQQGQRSSLDTRVPDELQPLVEQINRLLIHTEDTLRRSRDALGNLGHALKTPLAVLFSLSNRQELDAHPALRDSLRQQLDAIQQRLARELGRARLAGEALPGAYFDCARELADLCDTLRQIHGRDLKLHWDAPPGLQLPWDREDLLELFGNLLDNACKWAGAEVSLSVQQQGHTYLIAVDDDGPGIEPEQWAAVLKRGSRGDEQVEGHGLGLAIVRDILSHIGGELSLQDSPLGGLRVVISLPVPRLA